MGCKAVQYTQEVLSTLSLSRTLAISGDIVLTYYDSVVSPSLKTEPSEATAATCLLPTLEEQVQAVYLYLCKHEVGERETLELESWARLLNTHGTGLFDRLCVLYRWRKDMTNAAKDIIRKRVWFVSHHMLANMCGPFNAPCIQSRRLFAYLIAAKPRTEVNRILGSYGVTIGTSAFYRELPERVAKHEAFMGTVLVGTTVSDSSQ